MVRFAQYSWLSLFLGISVSGGHDPLSLPLPLKIIFFVVVSRWMLLDNKKTRKAMSLAGLRTVLDTVELSFGGG